METTDERQQQSPAKCLRALPYDWMHELQLRTAMIFHIRKLNLTIFVWFESPWLHVRNYYYLMNRNVCFTFRKCILATIVHRLCVLTKTNNNTNTFARRCIGFDFKKKEETKNELVFDASSSLFVSTACIYNCTVHTVHLSIKIHVNERGGRRKKWKRFINYDTYAARIIITCW